MIATYGIWKHDRKGERLWCEIPGYPKGSIYEIDLRRAQTSAAKCDWLAQIAEKSWADRDVLGGLAEALDATVGLRPGVGER
jgi:hypothetical protein